MRLKFRLRGMMLRYRVKARRMAYRTALHLRSNETSDEKKQEIVQ